MPPLLECVRAYATVGEMCNALREVWGDDFEGHANVVQVYVGYLRRKIDVPFGRLSLQTMRGSAGYRLVADG